MAIGLTIRIEGGTQEQYDAVDKELGLGSDPPAGLLVHSAGPIDGGWGVIDFWESRDAFDAFMGSRLGAAIAAAGDNAFPNAPSIKEFPVHNLEIP